MNIKKERPIVYLVGFLFSIPLAITSYINSSFLESFVGKYYVGLIYIFASIITIWGLLKIPEILNQVGNRKTTRLFALSTLLSLILLAFGKNIFIILPAFIIYFFSINTLIASLDIFVEDFSKTSIGKFRGLYLMVVNFAWVIAQSVSGSIIEKSSFRGIYIFAAFFMLLVVCMVTLFLREFKDPIYVKISIFKTVGTFFKNKNLSRIYFINLILKLFFALMVIYSPIYLREYVHLNWEQIGIIFTIMLIPFVLVDYPLGIISDRIGEKKILILGFIVAAFFTLLIPFITKPEVWIWALILFGTRVGASIVEVMSESYFFKEVRPEDAEEIHFFRNTFPLSYVLAPIIAIPILFFVPSFQYIFYIVGTIMLIGLFITLRLEDTK